MVAYKPQFALQTPWVSQWRPEVVGTLMFVVQGDQVLLIHKKTGHGAGRVNGPGGKVEVGESALQAACRETEEEVGISVSAAWCGAEMRFVEREGPQWLGFAFVALAFSGDARASDEADPFWCPIDEIPFERMWPDDAIWLPRVLSRARSGDLGPPTVGNFLFEDERLLDTDFVDTPSIWDAL